ncbi:MAG: hypothetical protein ACOCRX_02850 [Candidatus Woesearchaeota archaeon]
MRINLYTLIRDPLFLVLILFFLLFILVSFLYKFFGIKNFKSTLKSLSNRLDAVYLNKGMSLTDVKEKLGVNDSIKFKVNIPLKKSLKIINHEINKSDIIIGKMSNLIFLIDTNINHLGSNFNKKVGTRIRIPLNKDFNFTIKPITFFDKLKMKVGIIDPNLKFNEKYLVTKNFQETFNEILKNHDFKDSFLRFDDFSINVVDGIFTLFISNIESNKRNILESIFSSVSFIKLLYHNK